MELDKLELEESITYNVLIENQQGHREVKIYLSIETVLCELRQILSNYGNKIISIKKIKT